jgi:hypothetical protein
MATAMTWAVATAMRLAGNEEGKCKGGKSNATATRADGNGDSRWSHFSGGSGGNNRYGGGKQQQILRGAGNNQQNGAGGSGQSRDSGRSSGDCCSAAAMAGRGTVE